MASKMIRDGPNEGEAPGDVEGSDVSICEGSHASTSKRSASLFVSG